MTTLPDLMASVADQVRALRLRRGLYQADLADRIGRTPSTVSHTEGLRHGDMKLSLIVSLATGLDADVEIRIVPRPPRSPS